MGRQLLPVLLMAAPATRLAARAPSLPRAALLRVVPARACARLLLPAHGAPPFAPFACGPAGTRPAAAGRAPLGLSAMRRESAQALSPLDACVEPPLEPPSLPLPSPPLAEPTAHGAAAGAWGARAVDGVTVVRTRDEAERVLAQLCALTADTGRYHAIDTETHDVDIKKVGPVGNGHVTCLSIFAGEDLDFGNGPCVWVDNWSEPTEGEPLGRKTDLLRLFAAYLADERILKVVHNLSFDKHMLANEGLRLRGFAADTMHMARLWDSSLSKQNAAMATARARAARADAAADADAASAASAWIAAPDADPAEADDDDDGGVAAAGYSLAALTAALLPTLAKRPMKELFGVRKPKLDGSLGKVVSLPDPLELQMSATSRAAFIAYSAHDARATWHLRNELERRLRWMPWGRSVTCGRTMAEFYEQFMRPFAELLAEIEATGFKVDVARLPAVQAEAEAALAEAEATFRQWAGRQCAHARYMNIGSSAQLSQLLFAPPRPPHALGSGLDVANLLLPHSAIKAMGAWASPAVLAAALGDELFAQLGAQAASAADGADGPNGAPAARPRRAGPGRPAAPAAPSSHGKPKAVALGSARSFKVEIDERMRAQIGLELGELEAALLAAAARLGEPPPSAATLSALRAKVGKTLGRRKHTEIVLTGLGVPPPKLTKGGAPSTSAAALGELISSGVVRAHLSASRGEAEAEAAERALRALSEVSALETMLSAFVRPLQSLPDAHGRIHSSLNLNTETGRLSSQRPNLQNQPALDKDRFRIRDLFTCDEGNALIVADYEQLELRLLAHMTGCASMLEAFRLGGDFHSRTAMGMYPEIALKVERGELLIEREIGPDGQPIPGTAHLPLIKDAHAAERKKAKVLNFSIAYGKTAMGLAADWKVSLAEAKETLQRWYRDRPEVLSWQKETIEVAKRTHYVKTDMGRYRRLPGIAAPSAAERSHNERAAINTPVQGTAADVVMAAMIKVHRHEQLRELGWRMVLQVHDELILEGPEGSAAEALEIVRQCMEHPFPKPFLVELKVDAKTDKTWYRAK